MAGLFVGGLVSLLVWYLCWFGIFVGLIISVGLIIFLEIGLVSNYPYIDEGRVAGCSVGGCGTYTLSYLAAEKELLN